MGWILLVIALFRGVARVDVQSPGHKLRSSGSDDMVFSDWQVTTAWARPGSDRSVAIVVFALLAAASLLPVLLTPIPAMVDYPNHLARMYILSQNGTPDANPYYEVAWAFYPILAMDLLVPQMARLIGVENATRLY